MDSPLGETRMSQALRRRPARFGADRPRRTRGAARWRSLVEVQWIALRPHGLHGLEAVLHHVAVELDAVAVRIEEVDAAGDVVLGGTVERDSHPLQLFVGGAQLLAVVAAPRDVMQAWLRLRGRLAGRLLEQRQIVVLLAEAEEHRPALEVLVGHLQAQRLRVEIPRLLGVPDVQHDVTEPLRLDHCGPSPGAPRRPPYFTALLPRGRNGRVPDSPPPPVQGPTPSEKGGAVQERATHDWP